MCLRVSPSSTECNDRKTSRQSLRRANHCAATDQLCDHACNDFDDWHPNIHSFSVITPDQMIPPNPHCMAQSPLPLANTSHTINDTQARRRASGPSEPLPWLFTSLHCWWWISENWQQRITNSFWVLTVSVNLCYITNHPTTLQFNLQFNSWGLAQLSVISLGDDWWLNDLGWPYSSIYLLARATEAMYFFFLAGYPT